MASADVGRTPLILAFDTATEVVAVGIAEFHRESLEPVTVLSWSLAAHRQANSILLTQVVEALAERGATLADVAAIVVGGGPGSFTGVRIGVATAKGLARGLNVGLYTVSTSSAIAHRCAAAGVRGTLLVASDAMRREVYPSIFDIAASGEVTRRGGDWVAKPDVAARWWADELEASGSLLDAAPALSVVGTGLAAYADTLLAPLPTQPTRVSEDLGHPDGAGLIAAFFAAGGFAQASGEAGEALPTYTRLSDAEENERAARGVTSESSPHGTSPDAGEARAEREAISYRSLTPADVTALTAIEATDEHGHWSREQFADEFWAPQRYWAGAFIADGDGAYRMVGFVGVANLAGDVHVLKVAVHPAHRRHGIGRALIALAVERASEWGAASLTLEVRRANHGAIALYERAGCTLVGERPGYYTDPGDDALIYTLPIEPTAPAESGGPRVLAIESSCDETAAAVVQGDAALSDVVASQIEFHARFGGVVPEIASRKHTEAIVGVVDEALARAGRHDLPLPARALDAVAVTTEPGLIGALVVGLAFAKGYALAIGKPLYGVNHLEGHLYANVLADPNVAPPFVALVVSGGHTSLVYSPEVGEYRTLGETLDDATGEAFDKVAKVLGLGYPGGPVLSGLAARGNPAAIAFPRAMMGSGDYQFSLSGLKTAVINHIRHAQDRGEAIDIPDLAASFQQAIVDVQVAKSLAAVEEYAAPRFLLAGGVAANAALREALTAAMESRGVAVSVPPLSLCTDNAAMIGRAAVARVGRDEPLGLDADASAHAPLDTARP